jgi:transposase-like protein
LAAERDKAAAMRFFDMTMPANEVPEKISLNKSGANKATIEEINANGDNSDYRSPHQNHDQQWLARHPRGLSVNATEPIYARKSYKGFP